MRKKQETRATTYPKHGGARPGSGRKLTIGPHVRRITTALPAELADSMDGLLRQHGLNRSEWLRGLIERGLHKLMLKELE